MSKVYDVLIIGGGPAGLSIAIGLARQVHSALIIDSKSYRNEVATHMHNVAGFDHVHPEDFRTKMRSDLQGRYNTIEFKNATIKDVKKGSDGIFEACGEDGQVFQGMKLGLATGVRDKLEAQPEGFADCWGHGIFHCLFCHGFEERGASSAGVIATGMVAIPERLHHIALMAKRLSSMTTVYTDGNTEIATKAKPLFHSSKISFDNRKIVKFELVNQGPEVRIHFSDGTSKVEGFVASAPDTEQKAPFAKQLGLELQPSGDIQTTPPFYETSLQGCFAAGDCATPMKSAPMAVNMGGLAGAGAIIQLQSELEQKDEL